MPWIATAGDRPVQVAWVPSALGAPEALLEARDQDRSSVSPPLSQYPQKLLKIPLKTKFKGCGPSPYTPQTI